MSLKSIFKFFLRFFPENFVSIFNFYNPFKFCGIKQNNHFMFIITVRYGNECLQVYESW